MTEETNYSPETVKMVLGVLQKEMEAEEGRGRYITAKVQMMLTVAGILLTAVSFLLKAVFEQKWFINIYATLLLTAMLSIIIAMLLFLNLIRINPFS